ncbi:MAG: hypothetical protein JXR73_01445 [Candidatus Omnitrophica bacterium]|nr:hypothetical protein [Candidatus Omnitrophota bacterium]
MSKFVRKTILSAIVGFVLGLHGMPIHAQEVQSSIEIHSNDAKIARLYIAILDRDIETALSAVNASGFFPASWPKDATGVEMNPLPLHLEKSASLRTAEFACAMAYAYRTPHSKWYKNQQVLSAIESIIGVIIEKSTLSPTCSLFDQSIESTELILYLEPILSVYGLISSDLSASERELFHKWIDTFVEYLYKNPIRRQNDRGMQWCAVMALAGKVLGEPKYQKSADEALAWLMPLISPTGEYLDPSGINLMRAANFLRCLFLYRLDSEQQQLDQILIRSLQWYTRLYSFRGAPMLGFHNGLGRGYRTLLAEMAGPLAFYSSQEASFSQIISRYMEALMDEPPGFALERGGRSFLLASAYHQIPDDLDEIPYEPYQQIYKDSDQSHYMVIGKNYQTAVVLKDPIQPKGMQSWSYQGQPPLIFPSPPRYSRMIGFGYDTRRINAGDPPEAFSYKIASVTDNVEVLFAPTNDATIAYVFSKDVTIAIFQQPYEDALVEWILNKEFSAQPRQLEGINIQFFDSLASLRMPSKTVPNFETFEGGSRFRLHFKSEFCWFTFAGPESTSIVQPVYSGLLFIHIHEPNRSFNMILNISPQPYQMRQNFPGTTVPIPQMDSWSAKWIKEP